MGATTLGSATLPPTPPDHLQKRPGVCALCPLLHEPSSPTEAGDGFVNLLRLKLSLKGYVHEYVNHTQKEYARGDVHENRAECLFSLLKPYLRVGDVSQVLIPDQ
jgi:hypothetical protein